MKCQSYRKNSSYILRVTNNICMRGILGFIDNNYYLFLTKW